MAAFFGAGLSESESDPDESFSAAFLTGAFLAGFSLSDESESEEESFLAAFLTGAFLTCFSSGDSESDEESFLAAFFAGAAFLPLTTSTEDSESESDDEDSSTLDFLTGTIAFSEVFLDLFLAELLDLAETLDPALALFLVGFF